MSNNRFEKKDILDVMDQFGVGYTLHNEIDRPYATACCPFHDDKNPSFFISTGIQRCWCYTCWPEGGDVIAFARKLLDLDFEQAVSLVCNVIDEQTYLSREVANKALEQKEINYKILGWRLHKAGKKLPYTDFVDMCSNVDELLEKKRYIAVNRLLTGNRV